jgi:malate synthase
VDNPFQFDFIIDAGDSGLQGEALRADTERLVRYFLAALTVPEDELWVNLSPYEKDRIAPESLSVTDLGRDLLAQDYLLKQLSASLMYPENDLGKTFWARVYKKANELYGTTEIPFDTFNKVWIVPGSAYVYETENGTALTLESKLDVMMDEDMLAFRHQLSDVGNGKDESFQPQTPENRRLTSEIIRDVILPEIKKEVNEGQNFASMRQIYSAIILATWFKKTLKESLLGKIYVDQNKVVGVDIEDKDAKEKIYAQYLEAYKKGVYNYIKEEYDRNTDETIPHKYFSGGYTMKRSDGAMLGDEIEIGRGPARGLPSARQAQLTVFQSHGDAAMLNGARVSLAEPNEVPAAAAAIPAADPAMVDMKFRQDPQIGNVRKAFSDVYTPKALEVLEKFAPYTERIHALLEKETKEDIARAQRKENFKFLPTETEDGEDYTVPGMKLSVKQVRNQEFEGAPVPKEFLRPGITQTGPTTRSGQPLKKSLRSIAYQLLSEAEYVLWDGEDSLAQLNNMSIEGQRNMKLAISKDPKFMDVVEQVAKEMIQKGKRPADWNWQELIDNNYTTRVYRVRGLHLDDRHTKYTTSDGREISISGSIADLVLYVVNNYEALLDQGAPIAIYWPKLWSAEQAALVADVLDDLEATLEYKGQKLKDIQLEDGKPGGIIKVLALIENVKAAMQSLEIRAALGRHAMVLNMARWDYIATVIKAMDHDPNWVPDDFAKIDMNYPFMHAAEDALWRAVNTPDKNGLTILAEGGMDVQIPTIPDPILQEEKDRYVAAFMAKATANKTREAKAGFSRAWVAHPDMVDVAAAPFKELYDDGNHTDTEKAPVLGQTVNLQGTPWAPLSYTDEDAKKFFELAEEQQITVDGVRHDISVYIQYKNMCRVRYPPMYLDPAKVKNLP